MDTEELPPKTVKAQLVRLDDNLKQIERTQFAGLQRAPGSLPVLEAFQLFLETERKKTQKKLLAITAAAIGSILIALMASALYIRMALRNAGTRTDELSITAANLENNLDTLANRQKQAENALRKAARRMAEQQHILQEQTRKLEQQQQAVTDTRQEQASEVIRLREQLEGLLTDQQSIRRMLSSSRIPASRVIAADATERAATIGPAQRRQETQRTNPSYTTHTLPSQSGAGVRWMFPTGQE